MAWSAAAGATSAAGTLPTQAGEFTTQIASSTAAKEPPSCDLATPQGTDKIEELPPTGFLGVAAILDPRYQLPLGPAP